MIASPDDLDARYGSKDDRTWTGYKIHLTETCEEDMPRLITQVETTVATTADVTVTEKIQANLVERKLAPETHLVDGGYTEVEALLSSRQKGIDLVGPIWKDGKTASGKPTIHFAFNLADCSTCAARALCTRAEKIGRHLTVPPREAYLALQAARREDGQRGEQRGNDREARSARA